MEMLGETLKITCQITCQNPLLQAGVIVAEGVTVGPSAEGLIQEIDAVCTKIRAGQGALSESIKNAIRDLLRQGGYKPAGRGKPASEYLVQTVEKETFPFISNIVDINNLVSLETGLPISLLDLDKTGPQLVIRYGREHESYTFNPSGQSIELKGLLCLCQNGPGEHDLALGNPVKDSMYAKTTSDTGKLIGVVFSNLKVYSSEQLHQVMERFSRLLENYAGANRTEFRLLQS